MIFETFLEFITKILNISFLKKNINNPKREFKKVFNSNFLKNTHHYIKTKYFLSAISSFISLYIMLFLIYSGLFIKISLYFNSHINSPLLAHLAFIGFISFIFYIISLPFNIIDTFFIEKKFGFSTITIKIFIMDNIKILLLFLILGGTLLFLIFAFILKFQNSWWIFVWVLYTLFSLFIIKIYPTFIAPLFNKFEPIKKGKLKETIMSMAKKADFSVSRILKNDASKRSKHSNAYFTGMGKNKQIVLFDTIISNLSVNELTGVLAHEIGHYKKKHIWKMILIQTVITGISLYLVKQLTAHPFFLHSFFLHDTHYITRFIFASIFIKSFLWILQFPITQLSRYHEFSADNFSSKVTGKPKYLIDSLIKLTKDNLSNPFPHPLYSTLYYSHPPLIDRINNLKKSKKR